MKATITVSDRKEADQIRAGLADPNVRAFVKVMGILRGLPSHRSQQLVLSFVSQTYARQIDGADDATIETAAAALE